MKTRTLFLIFIAVLGILSAPLISENELPMERMLQIKAPPKPSRINAVMESVKQVSIVILQAPSHSVAQSRDWPLLQKQISFAVTKQLRKSGLNIAPALNQNDSAPIQGISEFRIEIGEILLKDSQQQLFIVKSSLFTDIPIGKQTSEYFRIEAWSVTATVRTFSEQDMINAIVSLVQKQAKEFTQDWKQVNASLHKPQQPAPAVGIEPALHMELGRPAQRAKQAEYQYVASKKSRIFHKPDCVGASRISQNNLVTYNSREEAVNDKKRPCKRCKP